MVASVARMIRCEFRVPVELKARAEAEAEAQGLDLSEFIRHAILARIVWGSAMRAAEIGALEVLDAEEFRQAIRRLEGVRPTPQTTKGPPPKRRA